MVEQNKVATSHMLEFHLRNKLRRISSILQRTESDLLEEALDHFFKTSKVVQEAQKKIIADGKYLNREVKFGNSSGWELRKGEDDI